MTPASRAILQVYETPDSNRRPHRNSAVHLRSHKAGEDRAHRRKNLLHPAMPADRPGLHPPDVEPAGEVQEARP